MVGGDAPLNVTFLVKVSGGECFLPRWCELLVGRPLEMCGGGLKMQDLKMGDHRNRTGKWRTSVISG